ncbi:MAG: dihydrofolate reductase family protein [bacterium]|nr:dihydrofolate reductase family protein [bacterium]
MAKVRINAFSISLDGYGAGPRQDLEHPLGVGGEALHAWVFPTYSFLHMHGGGGEGGERGVDDGFAARGFEEIGAWILGRNMFAPSRGAWPPDDAWRGWWGEEPPYHVPVFVLSHYAREPLVMEGGTTFTFVTDGAHAALERARAAADGRDVRIGGGVATARQYLRDGLVDEVHLAVSPVLLGAGEHLFAGLDLAALGYRCAAVEAGERATHVTLRRDASA